MLDLARALPRFDLAAEQLPGRRDDLERHASLAAAGDDGAHLVAGSGRRGDHDLV